MKRKAKSTEQPKPDNVYFVYCDHNSHACLEVDRKDGIVTYLTLTEDGIVVKRAAVEPFEHNYNKLLVDQSPITACESFLKYSQYIEISTEALNIIGCIIPNLTKEKYKMPKSQRELAENNKRAAAAEKCVACNGTGKNSKDAVCAPCKGSGKKGGTAPKVLIVKPADKPTTKKSDKSRESASQLFKDLIMEGKLTDDQIFIKVQAKYGLDAKKRGYVAWYRNFLKKAKKNPPDAVEVKK